MEADPRNLPIGTGSHGPNAGELGKMGIDARQLHRRKGPLSLAERKIRCPVTVNHHILGPGTPSLSKIRDAQSPWFLLAQVTAALRPQ